MARELTQDEYHHALGKLFNGDPLKYIEVWDALVRFFERQRVDDTDGAEQLADEAMHRLFLKTIEGVEVENVNGYAIGVARWVSLEHYKKRRLRQFISLDEYSAIEVTNPVAWWRPQQQTALEEAERAHIADAAWEFALRELKRSDYDLIADYYEYDLSGKEKLEIRKKLAQQRNMTLNSLRVNIHRLRLNLKRSYESQLKKFYSKGRHS